jgi:hypothetical protein
MKRGIVVSILLVLFAAGLSFADEVVTNMQSVVLEDFDDNDSRWIVRGGKFLAVDDEENQFDFPFQYQFVEGVWPEEMGQPESDNPAVLGVQASFTRRGYNWLEFIPVEEEDDEDGNPIPRAITIPGRPERLDLWAWGSNYAYFLEFQVRDHRGIVHNIRAGDVNYAGWQNLGARIPNNIPTAVRHVPSRRQLELLKVTLWTHPEESVAGFHFYMDQIKVLTDVFESGFDGEGLASPEFVQQTWGTEQPE